jgi:hypothetical protein
MVLKWSIGIKASTRVLKRQHFESKKIVPSFMTYQDEFVCFKETVQYYECELVGPSCVTIQFADKSMSFKATVSRGWIISFHELTVSGSFHAFQRDSITWVTRKWDPPPSVWSYLTNKMMRICDENLQNWKLIKDIIMPLRSACLSCNVLAWFAKNFAHFF